uniref:Rhodopirellula transposase DDE domain-containing protein n=1 Tax=Candidatus Kentrum sp. FM TaxID=2126340 RepID=A0A450VTY5_9GAMM|nr:MAG: Rhodopirellula transposase DDE domain-containing protein [Candidatus Kentron sp. FM]VFJ48691.1 MAG: Rhodopirellula transposase DDE domain-containing protein [Candidatus Kentron sp. FM]VFK08166.1 MAG: Rhodopirellula transposase DDE domain-containing protein [Candidatus Kentron sp. FM]
MVKKLTNASIVAVKKAIKLLTGTKRRQYAAQVTLEFLDGNTRKAERVFGLGRETVEKGLHELESGIVCVDNYSSRGNKKTETKNTQLREDILALVEPHSQTDPDFEAPFRYTRLTAKAVRKALIEEKGWLEDKLPSPNTVGNILNRMGYRLQKVQKSKPLKKIPQTDEIFANTTKANQEADETPGTIRISVDVKDKVKIGELSRRGKARSVDTVKAQDHDTEVLAKLVPVGIFEPVSGLSEIFFGTSLETSDLIADCLELWWQKNEKRLNDIKQLAINLDNGPHVQSHRSWFIKRLTEFSNQTGLELRLIYYPPYHSKYNPVERLWGILENHWNGALLDSVQTALEWAGTMTWNGIHPLVHLLTKVYQKGKKLTKKEMRAYEKKLKRAEKLPKWDVTILPQPG